MCVCVGGVMKNELNWGGGVFASDENRNSTLPKNLPQIVITCFAKT